MAELTRYVRTSADAGGDGTTNTDSSGDGSHAYDSLSAAEAGEQGNLDTANDNLVIICSVGSGSAADTTTVTFDAASWTTPAADNIRIQAAAGEEAVASAYITANYRLEASQDYGAIRARTQRPRMPTRAGGFRSMSVPLR